MFKTLFLLIFQIPVNETKGPLFAELNTTVKLETVNVPVKTVNKGCSTVPEYVKFAFTVELINVQTTITKSSGSITFTLEKDVPKIYITPFPRLAVIAC
jgi:hypothetical protein